MNKEKQFYVYIIRDPRQGKRNVPVYVGKGYGNRDRHHDYHSHNKRLLEFFVKCRALKSEVTRKRVYCATQQAAFKLEIRLIKQYGRRDLGTGTLYNFTDGGEGPSNPSAATRARIARAVHKQWRDPAFLKLRNSPQHKAMMKGLATKIFRKLWADPKHRAFMKQRYMNQEVRKAAAIQGAKAMRKLWADKQFRKMMSARIAITASKQWDDPQFKKKMTLAVRKKWKDQKFRKAQSARMSKRSRKLWMNPQFRKTKSLQSAAHARKQWADPNHRKTVVASIRRRWRDPAFRKAAAVRSATHARRMRRRWADPKFRAMMKQAHKTKQYA